MDLNDIQPAIALLNNNPPVKELRSHTYLSTYPVILAIGDLQNVVGPFDFKHLALLVYGWMPRVLRIDQAHLNRAVTACNTAQNATVDTDVSTVIRDIARCLHSVVGASKLLHFINPDIFPIWDSKIQRFRNPENSNMQNIQLYLEYKEDVHTIINNPLFPDFFHNFSAAYTNRLAHSNIAPYEIGHMRAVESAIFELSQAN